MAVPVLHLNLAPRPSLWRQRHRTLGWVALSVGAAFFLGSLGRTWQVYHQAGRAGREAVSLTEETRRAARSEAQIQSSLQPLAVGLGALQPVDVQLGRSEEQVEVVAISIERELVPLASLVEPPQLGQGRRPEVERRDGGLGLHRRLGLGERLLELASLEGLRRLGEQRRTEASLGWAIARLSVTSGLGHGWRGPRLTEPRERLS